MTNMTGKTDFFLFLSVKSENKIYIEEKKKDI
ncbi:hypothetical protein L323_18565 [Ruminiclostridium papyrosolvens C7]|uniref:Uncharacterized protein n=1 Tax=Ruminiclostridium papyrosolvens C7 TaxID=1330534 RepID=U4QY86_9FIRM|nr:hypothetical protein L323_18565 [Ruminiclostridium papyrosolvens C7]